MLESNLDKGRKHGTSGQVVWRECSCLENCSYGSKTQCAVLGCAQSLCCVHLFVTPWTVIHQAPLPMGLSKQEYWSGVPFPSLGDLPNPGMGPRDGTQGSPALDYLPLMPPGKPSKTQCSLFNWLHLPSCDIFQWITRKRSGIIWHIS